MNEKNLNASKIGRERPLSPHLQVYKPQLTSVLSILHRASIVAMYFGILIFCYIVFSFAFVQQCPITEWVKDSENGQLFLRLFLSFYAVASSYWVVATIRHLMWDFGYGFEIKTAYRTAYISIISTIILSAIIIYNIF
jgi:succinate dehydrogenase / fumarate reductase cytochrome b subunit